MQWNTTLCPIPATPPAQCLTGMGIPANVFAGGQENHDPLERISVQDMVPATKVVPKIAEDAAT